MSSSNTRIDTTRRDARLGDLSPSKVLAEVRESVSSNPQTSGTRR